MSERFHIFMVAGIDAISYAELAVLSLQSRCRDPYQLTLLTDSESDCEAYKEMLRRISAASVQVHSDRECADRASELFRKYPNVLAFREGHPCWRKITDPSLFVTGGQSIVVLDPDLFFPNEFTFEPTLPDKLILMRQRRHCLLPAAVVRSAFQAGIRLAHHTDIGVAQHTILPWDWIDNLIAQLGGTELPRVAHIESIVWAAIAMKVGGGYLDSSKWACWERTALKRILLLGGVSGADLFRLERIQTLKCFHASSGAKNWMVEAYRRGLFPSGQAQLESTRISPFVEMSSGEFERGEFLKENYHQGLRALRIADPLK